MSESTFYLNGKKPTRKNKSPEHDIQVRLVNYIRDMDPTILFSATVGGVRLAMHTAKKMKEAGYSKGIPDLLVFEPRGMYQGLAIEVKTKTGRPSPHQKEWVQNLNDRGWRAEICRGYEECESVINEYFNYGRTSQNT